MVHAPGSVVARRLERDAVRHVKLGELHEQLVVAHAVLKSDEHRPALQHRLDGAKRRRGGLRFHQDDRRVEPARAHFRRVREGCELRHRFGAAGEFQAVSPDRLDVRPVRVEHGNAGDSREAGRVEAAYRAGAYDENPFALSRHSG